MFLRTLPFHDSFHHFLFTKTVPFDNSSRPNYLGILKSHYSPSLFAEYLILENKTAIFDNSSHHVFSSIVILTTHYIANRHFDNSSHC
jgi:hypothetical protein